MENIDKEKINQNINDAYNSQTEKVKQLLESAKKNLADQKECQYDYTANKDQAKQLYKVNRIVTKKKEEDKQKEDKIDEKFSKMDERLNVHSKNLDIIFESVAQNNNNQISALKEISNKQNKTSKSIGKAMQEINAQKETNKQYSIEIKEGIQSYILEAKVETQNAILKGQKNLEETLLNKTLNMETNILNSQTALQSKIEEMQKENEMKLNQIKEEIIKSYQTENKYAINSLVKERDSYIKELQEKDREIRELNYKIYTYEEKLEREIAKREKVSIFAPLFRKQVEEEQQPTYISQILNYVY